MCDKVSGTSPKGSRKGAMVKGWCFLPLKTRKVLENQRLYVLGCKIVAPLWLPRGSYIRNRENTRSFKLSKGYCLCSLIVIERDDHLVIV